MRLVRAEILKLVRRRGLMIWSLLLTVGAAVLAEVILISLHAANAGRHGPAGGAANFRNIAELVAGLGSVAAILIGATAGSQDVANGVFRDLVVTGRKRTTLFTVRLPGALLVFLPMALIALVIDLACSFAFAGNLASPSGFDIGHELAYVVAITGINVILAVSLTAFASSRVVVGVLIAWNAIVSHILMSIGSLGSVRKGIDVAAAEHFLPDRQGRQVTMSTATAVIVLVVWAAVFSRAGRWWTNRVDA